MGTKKSPNGNRPGIGALSATLSFGEGRGGAYNIKVHARAYILYIIEKYGGNSQKFGKKFSILVESDSIS